MLNILEEALLDMEQIKKAVEEDAKNQLIESLTPQIKMFIDKQLYGIKEGTVTDMVGSNVNDMDLVEVEEAEEENGGEKLLTEPEVNKIDSELFTQEDSEVTATPVDPITTEKDPETGEEKSTLDLDALTDFEGKAETDSSTDTDVTISAEQDEDGDVEFEIDLDEMKNVLRKLTGDKNMKLKNIFLESDKKEDDEVIEIDEAELIEAINSISGGTLEADNVEMNEDEIMLDIDIDGEGKIDDVVVDVVEESRVVKKHMSIKEKRLRKLINKQILENITDVDVSAAGAIKISIDTNDVTADADVDLGDEEIELANGEDSESYVNAPVTSDDEELEVSVDNDEEEENTGSTAAPSIPKDNDSELEIDVEDEKEDKNAPNYEEILDEHKKTLKILQRKLEESNLMNTKLIYANKLLMNRELTKEQRARTIESLDKAKSLREVELVYEALVNEPKKETVNEDRRILAGGSSRTVVGISTVKKEVENNEVSRWQKLAGI